MADPSAQLKLNPLATTLIEQEEASLQHLQAQVDAARIQVQNLENQVASLKENAKTMPEDLGDWSHAPLRIQGLVTRIRQTHQLAQQVRTLK